MAERHFRECRQMLFLSGPRQVGKTTTAHEIGGRFARFAAFNWDKQEHRRQILAGPDRVAEAAGLNALSEGKGLVLFDELHKYGRWKDFLKGFFDTYGERTKIAVTGSARLDFFKRSGDSLMGRYFPYRMHPLSVAELLRPHPPEGEIDHEPRRMPEADFASLLQFGGFPEPLAAKDRRFSNRWRRLRQQLLFKEEVRELTRVTELGQMEVLAALVAQRVGSLTSLSSLAGELNVSLETVKRWLKILESLYYVFPVRPWWKNVARSLRKEPKYYLWDWSLAPSPPARLENLVAAALLKTVDYWTDAGLGDYGLHFVRDKEKREVDFLVSKDGAPWFLVEVKTSGTGRLERNLVRFHERLGTAHAFQAALDLAPLSADCFAQPRPTIVPLATFLAQLV
jgi:predicted AAA+ superfamily ATPase